MNHFADPARPLQPTRIATIDATRPVHVLTATARGLIEHTFVRAAQRAHAELMTAVAQAGLLPAVRSRIGLVPQRPTRSDDAQCPYVAGLVFGHDLATGQGEVLRPELPLSGSLAWITLAPGRHVVFTHVGPYPMLRHTWEAIYETWLPGSGETLRPSPPFELNLGSPESVPPEALRTEIWIPVA